MTRQFTSSFAAAPVVQCETSGPPCHRSSVFISNQDGSDERQLVPGQQAELIGGSLDGSKLLIRVREADGDHAYLTDVDYAVAETGSLVIKTNAAHGRGLSLVPMFHVAVVEANQILPDMVDLFERLPTPWGLLRGGVAGHVNQECVSGDRTGCHPWRHSG